MRTRTFYPILAGCVLGAFCLAPTVPLSAQAPGEDAELSTLVTELIAQQAALQANASKIDEQLGVIAEDVRQSRLFAARGGKGR